MRIIDNKKDYYDYLAGVLGIDDYITYDRRNSKRLVNKTANIINERCPMGWGNVFCTWKNGKDPNSDSVYDTGYDWDKGHKTVGIGNLVLVISLQNPMNFLMHIMYLQIGLVLLLVLLHMFFWFIGFSRMRLIQK